MTKNIEQEFNKWAKKAKPELERKWGLYDGWEETFPEVIELCEKFSKDITSNINNVLFLLEITNQGEFMKHEIQQQLLSDKIDTSTLYDLIKCAKGKNQKWQIYSVYDEIYIQISDKQKIAGISFLKKCQQNFTNNQYDLRRLNQSLKFLQTNRN